MKKNTIDLKRMYYFFLRTIALHYKSLLVSAGTIATALLFVTLCILAVSPLSYSHVSGFYHVVFIIGGLVFTSKIFKELNNPLQSFAYLTLPVSTLEKLIISWLVSSPIYIVAYTSIATVVMFLASLITMKFGIWESYIDTIAGHHIPFYLFIQTFFFLGACYFKKNIIMKTLFSILLTLFIIGIYAAFIVKISYGGYNNFGFVCSQNDGLNHVLKGLVLLTGPFMILVSYFKLKERQSS